MYPWTLTSKQCRIRFNKHTMEIEDMLVTGCWNCIFKLFRNFLFCEIHLWSVLFLWENSVSNLIFSSILNAYQLKELISTFGWGIFGLSLFYGASSALSCQIFESQGNFTGFPCAAFQRSSRRRRLWNQYQCFCKLEAQLFICIPYSRFSITAPKLQVYIAFVAKKFTSLKLFISRIKLGTFFVQLQIFICKMSLRLRITKNLKHKQKLQY